jgi:hypothetical protein
MRAKAAQKRTEHQAIQHAIELNLPKRAKPPRAGRPRNNGKGPVRKHRAR